MPRAPSENPARRNARIGPVDLPATGWDGEIPDWPLVTKATLAERSAWTELWRTPQAHAWNRLGWTRTVARYCRLMVQAERRGASAALLGQVTALEDRLGLTPKSMRLMLWRVAADEVGAKRDEQTSSDEPAPVKRLRAVDTSGA